MAGSGGCGNHPVPRGAQLPVNTPQKDKFNGADHLREGIVISTATERHVHGVGRAQLKLKSLKFLESEAKRG